VYADRYGNGELHLGELRPPFTSVVLGDDDLEVDLTRRSVLSRKGVIVASNPLVARAGADAGTWRRLAAG
jgi:predicted glutamine amidotransferase